MEWITSGHIPQDRLLVSPSGMVETPRLEAKENFVQYGSVKRYQIGAHTKHNLKVHFVWIANAEK